MPLPKIVAASQSALEVQCDALLAPGFKVGNRIDLPKSVQEVDAALDGALSEHIAATDFSGKPGSLTLVSTGRRLPARSVALVGMGRKEELTEWRLRRVCGAAARKLTTASTIASILHREVAGGVAATVEGLALGNYRGTDLRSKAPTKSTQTILFLDAERAEVGRAAAVVEAVAVARDLTSEPAMNLPPQELAARAQKIAADSGLDCEVYEENKLKKLGCGGILGVAAGSSQPPRLIRLHYKPKKARGKVVLAGKGVTFDAGGLSIKTAAGMEQMKTDKAGAAAVIATMGALEKLKVSVEVVALVPAAENMLGPRALKPGDVITHYGGKTDEVLNTDAEGRLLLADALAMGSEEKPDALVDIATLTGSMVIALGQGASGYFANDDTLSREIEGAAAAAGERFWRMPLYDEYDKELDSDIADIRNIGSAAYGKAIHAALFLRRFVGANVPWAHLDIAGPARSDSDQNETPKGATGVGTRTLLRWLESRGSGG
ncbi:MAG: leucyl aminopeptidase [Actinomycetota bacterium]